MRYKILCLLTTALLCGGCVTDRTFFTGSKPVFWDGEYSHDPEPSLQYPETCSKHKSRLGRKRQSCGNDYHLAIVEFDSDGQLRDPGQRDDAVRLIQDVKQKLETEFDSMGTAATKDHLTLVFFTHGWKHYANNIECRPETIDKPAECRSDLERFRIFLKTMTEDVAAAENITQPATHYDRARKLLTKSHIVGVFLTWRGAVVRRDNSFMQKIGGLPNFLSFWGRSRTASNIGGIGTDYMDTIYAISNEARRPITVPCEVARQLEKQRDDAAEINQDVTSSTLDCDPRLRPSSQGPNLTAFDRRHRPQLRR